MRKTLLEGYVGVKFRAICRSAELPAACSALHDLFRNCGEELRTHQMTPANGGNLSQQVDGGFVITTSGCNLGMIEPHELALVESCDLESERVTYAGPAKPSSEAMLHWLLYRDAPSVAAIVHAHDELATSSAVAGELRETAREEPYGTVALAELAARAFAEGGDIIVLKNHGYVARGSDLRRATETVIRMHLRLVR